MAKRKKHIVFVHGRHFKPEPEVLTRNWYAALRHGIQRDCTANMVKKFNAVEKTMVYYGDISNEFLIGEGLEFDIDEEAADRKNTLRLLKQYSKKHFSPPAAKKIYNNLPGKTSMKEFLADTIGEAAARLRVGKRLIAHVAPDMNHYWNAETQFGSDVRWRLTQPLAEALRKDHDILLVSHSLGTMIAYDVLWKFSYYGEYQDIRDKSISQLITMGAPLGDTTIKRNLKGAHVKGLRRYPSNIKTWKNFAAEDDFISHDQSVKDDFSEMVPALCDTISDHHMYNFAVRWGKNNPHHATGYLVHPKVVKAVTEWL